MFFVCRMSRLTRGCIKRRRLCFCSCSFLLFLQSAVRVCCTRLCSACDTWWTPTCPVTMPVILNQAWIKLKRRDGLMSLFLYFPDELHLWVCRLVERTSMADETLHVSDRLLRPVLPRYDVQTAALIIVTMKLLFGLDDHTEWWTETFFITLTFWVFKEFVF